MSTDKMEKVIETPVRYDRSDHQYLVRDADGYVLFELASWRYNWRNSDPESKLTPEDGHAVAEYIVTVLNGYKAAIAERDKMRAMLKAEPLLYECVYTKGKHQGTTVRNIAFSESSVLAWLNGDGYINGVGSLIGNGLGYIDAQAALHPQQGERDAD